MNSEVAELLGAFIGDGWIEARGNSLYIAGDPSEDKEYYDDFLAPLFSKHIAAVVPKEFEYWGVYGICCYEKEAIQKCKKIGFQAGEKATRARIPKDLMISTNMEVSAALLRGLFDADGGFYCDRSRASTTADEWKKKFHYSPEIHFGSCSQKLVEQIKILLKTLGIACKIRLKTKKGIKGNRNVNNHYALRIRKISSVNKWLKTIGSNNPRHKTRHDIWKRFGFLPPGTSLNQRKKILAGKKDPHSFY